MTRPSLYMLLPEIYRLRDDAVGGGLRAFCDVLDGARSLVFEDIQSLYRDWFVETCDKAVLPELAALVGRSTLPHNVHDLRGLVADAAMFQGQKGTRGAAERRLYRLGGWPVKLDRPHPDGSVDVTIWQQQLGTVRGVQPWPVDMRPDQPCTDFALHPLGVDCSLFAQPPAPNVVPTRLTRGMTEMQVVDSVKIVMIDPAGRLHPIEAGDVRIADLSVGDASAPLDPAAPILLDPEIGRIRLPCPGIRAEQLSVAFTYATPGRIGGGDYLRERPAGSADCWNAYVHRHAKPAAQEEGGHIVFTTVAEAIHAFASQPRSGIIRVLDSATYDVDGVHLDEADTGCPTDPDQPQTLTITAMDGENPVLTGAMTVSAANRSINLAMEGLWIAGRLDVVGAVVLKLEDVTLRSRRGQQTGAEDVVLVTHRDGDKAPEVVMTRCLARSLRLAANSTARVERCVIDGGATGAIVGDASVHVIASTILGDLSCRVVDARDTIVTGAVTCMGEGRGKLTRCAVGRLGSPLAVEQCIVRNIPRPRAVLTVHRYSVSSGQKTESDGIDDDLWAHIGALASPETVHRERLIESCLAEILPVGIESRIIWSDSVKSGAPSSYYALD